MQPKPFIERRSNIWINPLTTSEINETIYEIGSFCPFGRCLGEICINLSTGIAAQCISTAYEGELCSTCSASYSISLRGKRCVRCPNIWPLSFIAIVLGSLLAGLGLVISIMTELHHNGGNNQWVIFMQILLMFLICFTSLEFDNPFIASLDAVQLSTEGGCTCLAVLQKDLLLNI